MREIPLNLQNHIATGATTLAWCWKVTRNDGIVLGFTNFDKDLIVAGVTYSASSGVLGTEIQASLGLSVDNMDISGAIDSSQITEADLRSGAYDSAKVDVYMVNWQDVSQVLHLKSGTIGEVTRGKSAFQAEFRGLSQQLQQKKGRIYQFGCDVEFGCAKCGLNAASALYKGTGSVTATNGANTITGSGFGAYSSSWFTNGLLNFTSGNNSGRAMEVKAHSLVNGIVSFTLWEQAAFEISIGDNFSVTAGCDKTFKTCKEKFANQVNYRGFPYIPGSDYMTNYAVQGAKGQTGASLFN